jgi:epoxyqueuosine reductase
MLTSHQVKERAKHLGFDLCGIAPAAVHPELGRLAEWLARGYGGRMTYLNRTARVRADVRQWLPSARSVVVVASLYETDQPHHVEMADPARARIARYAWGDDYHDVMGRRLAELAGWMRDEAGAGCNVRWSVDADAVQEKVYARHAGIGWIGRNTCVINPDLGSWILLGVLASSLPLEPDEPADDRCGTCRLCIEACPVGAIVEPSVLDARRCLSYLTIEVRGSIPVDQRLGLGAHVFGCDICQDVCPCNATAPFAADPCWQPRPAFRQPTLASLWNATDGDIEQAIEGTALRRAGIRGLRRNVAVAIGNAGRAAGQLLSEPSPPPTAPACVTEPGPVTGEARPSLDDPVVAEHVNWARSRTR